MLGKSSGKAGAAGRSAERRAAGKPMRRDSGADGRPSRRTGAVDRAEGPGAGREREAPSLGGTTPGEGSLAALPPVRDALLELGFQAGGRWERRAPGHPVLAPLEGWPVQGERGAHSPRRGRRRRRIFKGTAKGDPSRPGRPSPGERRGALGWSASPDGLPVAATPGKSLRCAPGEADGVFERGIRSDRRVYEALTAKFVPWIPPRSPDAAPVSRPRAPKLSKS